MNPSFDSRLEKTSGLESLGDQVRRMEKERKNIMTERDQAKEALSERYLRGLERLEELLEGAEGTPRKSAALQKLEEYQLEHKEQADLRKKIDDLKTKWQEIGTFLRPLKNEYYPGLALALIPKLSADRDALYRELENFSGEGVRDLEGKISDLEEDIASMEGLSKSSDCSGSEDYLEALREKYEVE